MFVAKKYCITVGSGVDEYDIASFDKALVVSGLGNYNLVRVSSIVPPNAERVNSVDYPIGSVVYTAYAMKTTKSDELIASAIAAAIPYDENKNGVIMEYSCIGNKLQAINIAKKLAADALQRRGISEYNIVADGIDAKGENGLSTTTFAAIALM